ncbi:MAG: FeoC-like transcriptional regulator [Gammaproteobacteria bacterium]|nr:FeoC-like transcriptional regulator [Gammaproteobacteria bacterium]
MILSDIGSYVQERRQVTLNQIAYHFNAQPDAMRGMLEVWIRKGKISRQMATASCGESCQQCGTADTEIYIWGLATDQFSTGQCPTQL